MMDIEQEQHSCSLCYFIGTQEEFETHKKCALHGFNFTLKYFTEKRTTIVKNRDGIEIEALCENHEISHIDKHGTSKITLQQEKAVAEIEMEYKITNVRKESIIYLLNVLELVPQNYFNLSHKYEDLFKTSKDPAIAIKPKKSYKVKIKFSGPSYISTYRMPLAFTFQLEQDTSFTLIREMIVNIEKNDPVSNNVADPTTHNVYTGKSWNRTKIIPANTQSEFDPEFMVPAGYRRPLKTILKLENPDYLNAEEVITYRQLEALFDLDGSGLTYDNYKTYLSLLLWMEELKQDVELRKYNMEAVNVLVSGDPMQADVILDVPGLAEKRPSLVPGDRVHMRIHQEQAKNYDISLVYEGVISKVLDKAIEIDEFSQEFLNILRFNTLVDVRFVMSRLTYERVHMALSFTQDYIERLFPKPEQASFNNRKPITNLIFANKLISSNAEQSLAVENIVNNSSGIAPYILFGPPGTGKTITIVEAIVQIIKNIPNSKILVCAPANMACDMLTCKLSEYFQKNELIRVHSPHRDFTIIPELIHAYSNLAYDDNGAICGACAVNADMLNMRNYRIVVCTLMHAGKYAKTVKEGKSTLSFSHLVIDEAGQSMEPETSVPMGGLLESQGQLVLAGDPKQLGPICQSIQAKQFGLGISLMERLMTTNELYEPTAGFRDCRYIIKLVKNFRSHEQIIRISNKYFYENELICCSNEATQDPIVEADILEELPFGGQAIEFHGVSATECRNGRSPSYFNKMEEDVVMSYIVKLLLEFSNVKRINPPVKANDIGVISPYIKQVYKIKNRLEDLGGDFKQVEVGSTEAFQGREKRIMIISTVRGNSDLLEYDKKYNLGFLVDERRFNVAVTRAKSKLIIVGNPLCLTYNQYWRDYISECEKLGRYVGYRYLKRDVTLMDYITNNIRKVKIKEVSSSHLTTA